MYHIQIIVQLLYQNTTKDFLRIDTPSATLINSAVKVSPAEILAASIVLGFFTVKVNSFIEFLVIVNLGLPIYLVFVVNSVTITESSFTTAT